MSSILSSIAGIWLTVIIATATTFVLFGILFIIILVARRKVRKEEEAKAGKEVNVSRRIILIQTGTQPLSNMIFELKKDSPRVFLTVVYDMI